jgi:uncharacterized protein YggL (DUF469 family)
MKKRLRKKFHKGEFNVRGFEFRATFTPPLPESDEFLDSFIDFVEANDLGVGGSFESNKANAFVIGFKTVKTHGRNKCVERDCNDRDREKVELWLTNNGAVAIIGPLLSAYSGKALTWPPWPEDSNKSHL